MSIRCILDCLKNLHILHQLKLQPQTKEHKNNSFIFIFFQWHSSCVDNTLHHLHLQKFTAYGFLQSPKLHRRHPVQVQIIGLCVWVCVLFALSSKIIFLRVFRIVFALLRIYIVAWLKVKCELSLESSSLHCPLFVAVSCFSYVAAMPFHCLSVFPFSNCLRLSKYKHSSIYVTYIVIFMVFLCDYVVLQ